MKLDTRWLDWQPSTEKFEKSAQSEPAKTAESIIAVSAGSNTPQNRDVFQLELDSELYEESIGRWARERCIFRDRVWSGLGTLHGDYAVWADKVDRDVPASFHIFKQLCQNAGFKVTDDGLVYGLILIADLRTLQCRITQSRSSAVGR